MFDTIDSEKSLHFRAVQLDFIELILSLASFASLYVSLPKLEIFMNFSLLNLAWCTLTRAVNELTHKLRMARYFSVYFFLCWLAIVFVIGAIVTVAKNGILSLHKNINRFRRNDMWKINIKNEEQHNVAHTFFFSGFFSRTAHICSWHQ